MTVVAGCGRSAPSHPEPLDVAEIEPPKAPEASPPGASANDTRGTSPPVASTTSRDRDGGSPPAASASLSSLLDASASSCRPIRGPIELPLRGPAALVARSRGVDAVFDDDGHPRVLSFTGGPVTMPPLPLPPVREPAEGVAGVAPRVPCAVAGEIALCADRTGAVHRARLTGEDDRTLASSRTGTRIAAASLAGGHTALAYLASRKTSEGWVSEAWLAVDDDLPMRISEDGSGATAVDLASHGPSVLALTVDARTALTAMHTRVIAYDHGARLADDVVVFVGGPGDRRTAATLVASATGPTWALLPIARDTEAFGLAIVRLEEPPRVDEPVVWSMYPNGLDPAAVASAATGARVWIARVRPQATAPGAPHVLELGELSSDGVFAPRAVIPTGDAPTDVSLASDGHGALWLAWLDASGSWLERLACR